MIGTKALASLGVAALLTLGGASAHAALVIDDFESYTGGNAIATSASSTPWLRFGNAIDDNLFATTSAAFRINGVSARIEPNWKLTGANNANIRRNFVTPTDLTNYDEAEIKVKSTNVSTTATMKLSFTDGVSIWQTTTGVPVTGSVQTLTFDIAQAAMTRTGGSGAFGDVLDGVTAIGFRFENTNGSADETFSIDDFVVNPVPEPAAVGLLVTVGLLLARRRRQNV